METRKEEFILDSAFNYLDVNKSIDTPDGVSIDISTPTEDNTLYGASIKGNIATYIGAGINVLEASGPNANCTNATLFKPIVYDESEYIETISVDTANTVSVVSSKFEEIFHSTEVEATLKSGQSMAFFTGSFSAKYKTSSTLLSTARFYKAIASVESEKHVLGAAYVSSENMRKIVIANVLEDIDNPSIEPHTLFLNYGTHIITEASIGGFLEVNGLYNSKESINDSEFKATIDAACAYVSASASVTASDKQKKVISETTINATSSGGDMSVTAGLQSFDEISSAFKKWAQGINNRDTHVLSKVYKYMPIWELAKENKRKDTIKNKFVEAAQDKYAGVKNYFHTEIVALESLKPISGKYLGFSQIGFGSLESIRTYLNGEYENAVSLHDKIGTYDIFEMRTYDDGRVSFFVYKNPLGSAASFASNMAVPQYLTVHYKNEAWDSKTEEQNQLFVLTPANRIPSERQKFTLESVKERDVLIGYKLKWRPSENEGWRYLTYREDVKTVEFFSLKVTFRRYLAFMNGSSEYATVIKLVSI